MNRCWSLKVNFSAAVTVLTDRPTPHKKTTGLKLVERKQMLALRDEPEREPVASFVMFFPPRWLVFFLQIREERWDGATISFTFFKHGKRPAEIDMFSTRAYKCNLDFHSNKSASPKKQTRLEWFGPSSQVTGGNAENVACPSDNARLVHKFNMGYVR